MGGGYFSDLEGGCFFFSAVREGDSLLFASDDENECHLWVMAMYNLINQRPMSLKRERIQPFQRFKVVSNISTSNTLLNNK